MVELFIKNNSKGVASIDMLGIGVVRLKQGEERSAGENSPRKQRFYKQLEPIGISMFVKEDATQEPVNPSLNDDTGGDDTSTEGESGSDKVSVDENDETDLEVKLNKMNKKDLETFISENQLDIDLEGKTKAELAAAILEKTNTQ